MAERKVRELEFPTVRDPRGNLSFIESSKLLPFQIARLYYVYSVPVGAERGGHAHRALQQCIIPIAGSFDVVLHDGQGQMRFTLCTPSRGLYVPQMVWRELTNFSANAVCLVAASKNFDESDYIRDFSKFVEESAA